MTTKSFEKFCKKHKPVKITHGNTTLTLHFDNGEWVRVNDTYDGLSYTHSKEPKPDNSQLLKDLAELTGSYYDRIKEKYSTPISI